MEIKATSATAEKWARVTPQRVPDYQLGVANPRRPWQAAAAASNDTYKTAVTAAANKDMYRKGVMATSQSDYQQKTLAKGPGRFAEGVQVGQDSYAKGFAPYAEVIRATALPPRFAKGDPRNIQRVAAVATALAAKRQSM